MAEPTTRVERKYDDWLEFRHDFGAYQNQGDTTFTFTANEADFMIEAYTCRGRDRDNYESYDESEIKLSRDEALELYIALHVWLERTA